MATPIQKAEQATESAQNNETSGDKNTGTESGLDKETLHTVADALDLSEMTRQTAEAIYRAAIREGVHEGRPLARIQVACVPLAARVHAKPVALGRVAEVVSARVEEAHIDERRELSWTLRVVAKATGTNTAPTSAEAYIAGIVEGIESDAEGDESNNAFSDSGIVVTRARSHLMGENGKRSSSGSSPSGIAAGAVYRVSEDRGEKVTTQQIADAAGVSCPTVRKYARSFLENDSRN